MTLPRTVADVLADHVRFEIEAIDRLYLNVWQPRLAYGGGVAGFFTSHRGYAYASTALMDPMSKAFVADIHHFIAARGVDLVHFAKGQRKDEVTQRLLAGFTGAEGVLYVGRAQEKSNVWGTQRRYHADGRSYAWLVRSTAFINFFYFYCVDEDFGPFFIKFSTYFPFTAKLCINGNEWAKRQAAKAGIGFEPLDNGFAAVDDVAALQGICDSLGPGHIEALLRKWLAILPSPFTVEDQDAGYAYELSVLQAEFSLTQMLDAPVAGRIFFEQVLRDNLDIGRPDQISLVFGRRLVTRGRRRTPGTFRTRVITDGVTPSLHVDYKNSKIKQYHKLGKAIRTETTINDTRDFGLSKRLTNLPALRQIGFTANRRLLGEYLGRPPHGQGSITAGQATCDLRRLREHGLIERIPHTHRYKVTSTGLRHAMFLTRVHDRVPRTGLAELAGPGPAPLRKATTLYQAAIDDLTQRAGIAA